MRKLIKVYNLITKDKNKLKFRQIIIVSIIIKIQNLIHCIYWIKFINNNLIIKIGNLPVFMKIK
jgi:hypothetical protein